MIIGISGKIYAGKDATAKIIQELYPEQNWQIKKFAGKLKQVASLLSGVPVEQFEDQGFKKLSMPPEWGKSITKSSGFAFSEGYEEHTDNVTMTYRELLQKLGTEAIRDVIHTNAWVNALFADYKPNQQWPEYGPRTDDGGRVCLGMNSIYPSWIITDCRFPNEAQSVVDRGGKLLRINRNQDTGNHPSETALDNWNKWDYVIDNTGSLDDLVEQVKKLKL